MEQRRLELKLGLKDVSERMVNTRPSISAIHQWEQGARKPRNAYIPDIAKALETSQAWLLGFTDDHGGDATAGALYANLPDAFTFTAPGRGETRIESDNNLRVADAELARHKLDPANLFFVRATGDVMGDKIADGDLVLVDRSITTPNQADLFALLVNDRIWFRWIRPEIDGSFTVFAENESKSPATVISSEKLPSLCILGRVAGITRFR